MRHTTHIFNMAQVGDHECILMPFPSRPEYSLFGKLDSVKSTKEQHVCVVTGELNDSSRSKLIYPYATFK